MLPKDQLRMALSGQPLENLYDFVVEQDKEQELLQFISMLNEHEMLAKRYDSIGGFKSRHIKEKVIIADTIVQLKGEGYIEKGDIFIELGSGSGSNCYIADFLAMHALGYERNGDLVSLAQQGLEKCVADGIIPGNVEFYCASYYPRGYKQTRGAKVRKHEKKAGHKTKLFFRHKCLGEKKHITEEQLAEGKLFYAFTWESQTPSVLELFSRYASSDAYLYLDSSGFAGTVDEFNGLLDELGLRRHEIERLICKQD
jgi:hypothetical protein